MLLLLLKRSRPPSIKLVEVAQEVLVLEVEDQFPACQVFPQTLLASKAFVVLDLRGFLKPLEEVACLLDQIRCQDFPCKVDAAHSHLSWLSNNLAQLARRLVLVE
jgi:hypothetical protein